MVSTIDRIDVASPVETAIAAENLACHFHEGGHTIKAVDGVSFALPAGTLTAITGSSGSGKTTLLNLIGSLEKPTGGTLRVAGVDVHRLSESGATSFRRHKVGFVFQAGNLIPNLSAVENVTVPMELAGISGADRHARALELLESVGIEGSRQKRRPGHLSGGEQQRVAIARALANRPQVVLADEPTGSLDSENGENVMRILRELSDRGTTVVVATHDPVVAKHCHQLLRMKDGHLTS
jgi:putative ABC transport system ATP-binding protein